MSVPHFRSIARQAADYLRGELVKGRWSGTIPGVGHLAPELGVNVKTAQAALRILESEGVLAGQGPGRRRRIVLPEHSSPESLHIAILEHSPPDLMDHYMVDLLDKLGSAGHRPFFTPKTLTELGMKLSRIKKLVQNIEADAWIVGAGSHEVLQWFATRPTPVFAFFGRIQGLPIAGTKPDKPRAVAAATRHLIDLGHHRIVLLARASRRRPEPGRSEQAFLKELQSHGIRTGVYNLPEWEESIDGYTQVLNSLFEATPPTALIIDEMPLFIAAQQFLGYRSLQVPRHVSLVCTDGDPAFSWCNPSIAHIRWDHRPVVRQIGRAHV